MSLDRNSANLSEVQEKKSSANEKFLAEMKQTQTCEAKLYLANHFLKEGNPKAALDWLLEAQNLCEQNDQRSAILESFLKIQNAAFELNDTEFLKKTWLFIHCNYPYYYWKQDIIPLCYVIRLFPLAEQFEAKKNWDLVGSSEILIKLTREVLSDDLAKEYLNHHMKNLSPEDVATSRKKIILNFLRAMLVYPLSLSNETHLQLIAVLSYQNPEAITDPFHKFLCFYFGLHNFPRDPARAKQQLQGSIYDRKFWSIKLALELSGCSRFDLSNIRDAHFTPQQELLLLDELLDKWIKYKGLPNECLAIGLAIFDIYNLQLNNPKSGLVYLEKLAKEFVNHSAILQKLEEVCFTVLNTNDNPETRLLFARFGAELPKWLTCDNGNDKYGLADLFYKEANGVKAKLYATNLLLFYPKRQKTIENFSNQVEHWKKIAKGEEKAEHGEIVEAMQCLSLFRLASNNFNRAFFWAFSAWAYERFIQKIPGQKLEDHFPNLKRLKKYCQPLHNSATRHLNEYSNLIKKLEALNKSFKDIFEVWRAARGPKVFINASRIQVALSDEAISLKKANQDSYLEILEELGQIGLIAAAPTPEPPKRPTPPRDLSEGQELQPLTAQAAAMSSSAAAAPKVK